jgi:hypothetical protein
MRRAQKVNAGGQFGRGIAAVGNIVEQRRPVGWAGGEEGSVHRGLHGVVEPGEAASVDRRHLRILALEQIDERS